MAFALAKRYADTVFILSAKHELVRPEEVLAPYEDSLVGKSRNARRTWAERVHGQLSTTPEYRDAKTILWLAGETYRDDLLPRVTGDGKTSIIPMQGLAQGQQLSWLKGKTSGGGIEQREIVKKGRAAPKESTASVGPDDFRRVLRELKSAAKAKGKTELAISAGQLHRAVGGYPATNHRMPICCRIMREEMGPGDEVIAAPPRGQGASLEIRYRLG
jgi:5-methylcytosine-specific restriction protein A